MNLTQKDKFVEAIIDDLKASILSKVDSMPEHWDGHEIRQYIADYYTSRYIIGTALSGSRKKDYKNTLLITNLI